MTRIVQSAHCARSVRALGSAAVVLAALTCAGIGAPSDAHGGSPAARRPAAWAPKAAKRDTVVLPHRVVAYYFHTTKRCATCRKIEAYSREAVESAFARELKDGRLVLRVVNVEEKGNEHFVKDYGLYTKSLIVVDEVKGRQARWKNLAKVWELVQDREGFLRYVQGEVRGYLTPGT